jgi:hypothetical protein
MPWYQIYSLILAFSPSTCQLQKHASEHFFYI